MNSTLKKMSILIIILIIITSLGNFYIKKYRDEQQKQQERAYILKKETDKKNAFSHIQLIGKSAVVFDVVNNETIFEYNPHLELPIASITKVMTAYIATQIFDKNKLITLSEEDIINSGEEYLTKGDSLTAKTLSDYMMLVSSNASARAFARTSGTQFEELMNSKAKELGMKNTHYYNPTGLDRDAVRKVSGPTSSAFDTAILFNTLLKTHSFILESTSVPQARFTTSSGKTFTAKNTNILSKRLPNNIGSKTGFTKLAGGSLAVVINADMSRPIIIVVLGSTEEGRFTDIEQLYNATINYVKLQNT